MPSWLITGSSRGVGLGIVKNLLEKDVSNFVIATARNLAVPALKDLASKYPKERLQLVHLDVADATSVEKAVEIVTPLLPGGLDYLINNAAIHPQPLVKFEDLDYQLFEEEMLFNTVIPVRVTRLLLPLVKKSKEKKVLFITSAMGSFELTYPMVNQCNAYSTGKAALNMVAHKWAASLKYEGVSMASVHPGWVNTEIGDPIKEWMTKNAPDVPQIEPEESGAGIVRVAEQLTVEKTGSFLNYTGKALPR